MRRQAWLVTFAVVMATTAAAATADAQVVSKKALTLDGARRVIAAAEAEARRHNAGGVIAVVDDGGNLVALERLDGTFVAGATISIGKARTAATFKLPTKRFEDIIKNGRTAMVALPDFTPLQGGGPIVVDGQVIGAVGVSGAASAAQDEEIAAAGAAGAASFTTAASAGTPATVTFLDGAKVATAFSRGMPLLEVEGYKIHASRRDGAGMAEIHDTETDVLYVLDGAATLVTGGTVVGGTRTEPGQIRGSGIEGGQSRRIGKGDVVVIPNGVPYLFTDVQAPLLYFVVKPIAMAGGAK
jgi:glc operon protein GlcG